MVRGSFNLSRFVNVSVFIASFAVGMFFVYIYMPDTRKILVYPTHENAKLLQYRDKTGTCFAVEEKEVGCPKDAGQISKIPVQS